MEDLEDASAEGNGKATSEATSEELRAQYKSLVDGMIALNKVIDEKLQILEEKQVHYDAISAQVNVNKAAAQQKVELNVGGRVFSANRDVFLRWEGTYFHSLLCGNLWNQGEDGMYFIDRDPDNFDRIMKSLRTGYPVDFDGLSSKQAEMLEMDMDYYQLSPKISRNSIGWDISRCSIWLTISKDGRTVFNTGNAWGLALTSSLGAASFRLRVNGFEEGLSVGFMKGSMFSYSFLNFRKNGWFINEKGQLFSNTLDAHAYTRSLKPNDLVGVHHDKRSGKIRFEINGKPRGVAFSHVDNGSGPLSPCVGLFNGGCVTLEDIN